MPDSEKSHKTPRITSMTISWPRRCNPCSSGFFNVDEEKAVVQRCSVKSCSSKIRKIHRKTAVSESLF